MPPTHAGMASLTPAETFSLMVPQPVSPLPARATARIVAMWRALVVMGRRLQLSPLRMMDLRRGLTRNTEAASC
jgi:hypothetical protein